MNTEAERKSREEALDYHFRSSQSLQKPPTKNKKTLLEAPAADIPNSSFALNMTHCLNAAIQLCPALEDMHIKWVSCNNAAFNVLINGDIILIDSACLNFGAVHKHGSSCLALHMLESGTALQDDLFLCDHAVLYIFQKILDQMYTGQYLHYDPYRHYQRAVQEFITLELSLMPRAVRARFTERPGEVVVTWRTNFSQLEEEILDPTYVVKLHERGCGGRAPNQAVSKRSDKCKCLALQVSAASKLAIFRHVNFDYEYSTSISRQTVEGENSIFNLPCDFVSFPPISRATRYPVWGSQLTTPPSDRSESIERSPSWDEHVPPEPQELKLKYIETAPATALQSKTIAMKEDGKKRLVDTRVHVDLNDEYKTPSRGGKLCVASYGPSVKTKASQKSAYDTQPSASKRERPNGLPPTEFRNDTQNSQGIVDLVSPGEPRKTIFLE